MPNSGTRRGNLRAVLAMAVVLAAFVAVELRLKPPEPREDAELDAFSALRARAVLTRILGDERPHPTGSPANAAVRSRIEDELRAIGIEPRRARTSGCGRGACREVENVVATLRGTASADDAVLLACHYDSVPAGPGAADDGAGVATLLEVARALLRGRPTERDVVLLFGDGEEAGLLGADAFVRSDTEARRIAAAINVEARGTEGPSLMFETSGARIGAIRMLGKALARPVSSSLFGGVYERMPNDTDLTVFRRAGWLGFNFAFVRGVDRYHTAADDLRHLSSASLQHQGDNVLALTRVLAMATTPLRSAPDEPRAVWFDVLSWRLVMWPESAVLPLALAAGVLFLSAIPRILRRTKTRLRDVLGAVGMLVGGWVAAALSSALFMELWRLGKGGRAWSAHPDWGLQGGHPWPGLVAVAALTAWCVMASTARLRRMELRARLVAVWSPWCLAALVVSAAFPPASYLLVVPAAAAAGILVATARLGVAGERRQDTWAAWPPALVAALLWFPVHVGLRDALGLDAHAALALTLAVPASTFSPLLVDASATSTRRVFTGILLAVVVATLGAMLVGRGA